jgi:hypothetical protein
MLGVSLRAGLYIIHEDQVFVAYVVVIDLIRDLVITNVINWLEGAIMKHSTIAKIRKYKKASWRASLYFDGHESA